MPIPDSLLQAASKALTDDLSNRHGSMASDTAAMILLAHEVCMIREMLEKAMPDDGPEDEDSPESDKAYQQWLDERAANENALPPITSDADRISRINEERLAVLKAEGVVSREDVFPPNGGINTALPVASETADLPKDPPIPAKDEAATVHPPKGVEKPEKATKAEADKPKEEQAPDPDPAADKRPRKLAVEKTEDK